MQHYRAPTRLLDWTYSPYVALYFAVEDRDFWYHDGAVWMFDAPELERRMEEKHPEVRERLGIGDSSVAFKLSNPELFDPMAPPYLLALHSSYNDARMIAQRGVFTVCLKPRREHSRIIDQAFRDHPGVWHSKIVIPSRLKPEFLRRLRVMNIGAHSLFPGMDGIGRSMAEWVILDRHSQK